MYRSRLALAAVATMTLALTACGNASEDDENGTKDPGSTPTGSTPTATEPTRTAAPTGDVIDLTTLEKGEDMVIPYIDGTVVHTPLKAYDVGQEYHQLVRFSEFTFALAQNGDNAFVAEVAVPEPDDIAPYDTTGKIVTNESQDAVLWVGTDGTPYVLAAGSTTPEPFPTVEGSNVTPVALLDQDTAYLAVQRENGDMETWIASTEGGTMQVKGISAASDAYADSDRTWVLGATEITDGGSCWTVLGEPGDDTWETCDYSLDAFNSDGSKILAGPAYRDGFGDGEVAILDASDGSVLAAPELAEGAVVVGTAWEDEDTVLANVYQDGEWAIVRIHADGSLDLATEPVKGGEEDGYVLGLS